MNEKACAARSKEFHGDGAITHRVGVADQLIEPLLARDTHTLCIRVHAMIRPGLRPIKGDPEADRGAALGRAQDKVQVTRRNGNTRYGAGTQPRGPLSCPIRQVPSRPKLAQLE